MPTPRQSHGRTLSESGAELESWQDRLFKTGRPRPTSILLRMTCHALPRQRQSQVLYRRAAQVDGRTTNNRTTTSDRTHSHVTFGQREPSTIESAKTPRRAAEAGSGGVGISGLVGRRRVGGVLRSAGTPPLCTYRRARSALPAVTLVVGALPRTPASFSPHTPVRSQHRAFCPYSHARSRSESSHRRSTVWRPPDFPVSIFGVRSTRMRLGLTFSYLRTCLV